MKEPCSIISRKKTNHTMEEASKAFFYTNYRRIKKVFPVFFVTIFFFLNAYTAIQAQDKKVAMLEPIPNSEGISGMVKNMVRGELTRALSLEPGISAFTRLDVDQMMKEFNFQESGMVNDEQRKKLGQMSGADYVCISKISKEGEAYYIEASLIHVESGRIENPGTAFTQGGIESVNYACQKVAADMVGKKVEIPKPITRTSEKQTIKTTDGNSGNVAAVADKKSVFPIVVTNEAYQIAILNCRRVDREITINFKVINTGRYSTIFSLYGADPKIYTHEGDMIEASSYTIGNSRRADFAPNIILKGKMTFKNVPKDVQEFSHLIFRSQAQEDQPQKSNKYKTHTIENLPVKIDKVKSFSNKLNRFNSFLEGN